mmetsp:Transcript_98513/g.283188  ORF Transcript_98513/g.283188 Transcript_98513/m.283188 type:complete len:278 (+) Transcript_98513:161-994(+)
MFWARSSSILSLLSAAPCKPPKTGSHAGFWLSLPSISFSVHFVAKCTLFIRAHVLMNFRTTSSYGTSALAKTDGFQSAPRATMTAAGLRRGQLGPDPPPPSPPPAASQRCQKSSMWRLVSKSPFAKMGTFTSLQSKPKSSHLAGWPWSRLSSVVRMCNAMASAPLRSQSRRKSIVCATVGNIRILHDTAHQEGNSRLMDFSMSATTWGFSSSAAPVPPVELKGAVQPMFTSTPRTSPQTCKAAFVAKHASLVPTWKISRCRSSSHVLNTTFPSCRLT